MNLEKDKHVAWAKAYNPKEFFAILFVMCLFICPAYQVYHDFIAQDSKLHIHGYVINTNQMKIDNEYKYTVTIIDKEKKYTPVEKSVDAREYFTTKIGDSATFTIDNKNVKQNIILIAYIEYVIIGVILLFLLLATSA